MLVRNENRKNSILEFMSQSLGYLAYQIAEHKGAKGSKYITVTPAEYRAMLGSAMGGGAWICLVVLIKNLLIRVPMAIFWHGFAYSVNYSLGFILIEEIRCHAGHQTAGFYGQRGCQFAGHQKEYVSAQPL